MRILLVNPPSHNNFWHEWVIPYNVASLLSYLENKWFDVNVIDYEIEIWYRNNILNEKIDLSLFSEDNIIDYLVKWKWNNNIKQLTKELYKIINLDQTIITSNYVWFYINYTQSLWFSLLLASIIKKLNNNSKIIFWWWLLKDFSYEIIKNHNFVDFVIYDTWELSIESLLTNNENYINVPNLIYRYWKIPLKSKNIEILKVNYLPVLNFDKFNLEYYKVYTKYYFWYDKLIIPYKISEWCYYKCFFCSSPKYNFFNIKSIEKVISDIDYCKNIISN